MITNKQIRNYTINKETSSFNCQLQSQIVTREKLHKTLYYEKFEREMLMKSTPEGNPIKQF